MTFKEKRKYNPRRRLLIKLIFGLVLIVSSIAVGIQALRPTGAQIVYIAPDDNGYDAIWIADVKDPENPRQLTYHEGKYIGDFQVSAENSIIFYRTYFGESFIPSEFWTINLDTGEHANLQICETEICLHFEIKPDGEWIAFEEFSSDNTIIEVIVQNLQTLERRSLFNTVKPLYFPHQSPLPNWVGNTDSLIFRLEDADDDLITSEFTFYDVEEDQFLDTKFLDNIIFWTPDFSDDGSLFNNYNNIRVTISSPINITYLDNPTNIIYEADYRDYLLDWHPNNDSILVSEGNFSRELQIYNFITGEVDTLTSISSSSAEFNYDATKILYATVSLIYYRTLEEIFIFDMETRESITLPIIGRNPQWVNGGR